MTNGHEGGCPVCGAPWAGGEVSERPTLESLESQVPERWVSSMWSEVKGAMDDRRGARSGAGRWVVPVLSAAALVLLVFNGLTLHALRQSEARSSALAEAVLDPQQPAGRSLTSAREGWVQELADRDDLTVTELRALLVSLPAGTRVATGVRSGVLSPIAGLPAAWRRAVARLEGTGAVTTDDLLRLLDELDLPEGMNLPAARIADMLS